MQSIDDPMVKTKRMCNGAFAPLHFQLGSIMVPIKFVNGTHGMMPCPYTYDVHTWDWVDGCIGHVRCSALALAGTLSTKRGGPGGGMPTGWPISGT